MLYVKYRPSFFGEIIRPNPEIDFILNKLQKGELGHAHIFCGSRGVGKTTTARLISKALNCLNFKEDVCGTCSNCIAIQEGSFIDILEIDGASNRGIDSIRELKEIIKFPPVVGKKKVVIIDEAHMLTIEAFNALLKSLEEPPEFLVFVLCTTEPQKIPETVRSRCQIHFLSRPTDEQIIKKLDLIVAQEKISITEEELRSIARASNGGFRDAETLLTQFNFSGDTSLMSDYYSISSQIKYLNFIFKKDLLNVLKFHQDLDLKGIDVTKWLAQYISFLRIVLYFSLEGIESKENRLNDNDKKELRKVLRNRSFRDVSDHITEYIEMYSRIKYSQFPEILLEVTLATQLSSIEVKSSIPDKEEERTPEIISGEELKDSSQFELVEDSAGVKENIEVPEIQISKTKNLESTIITQTTSKSLQIDEIRDRWAEVISSSSKINKSLEALLNQVNLVSFQDGILLLEGPYKFHIERLGQNLNKLTLEEVLFKIFNQKILYTCRLSEPKKKVGFSESIDSGTNDLTDYNVVSPKELTSDDILSLFNGSTPKTN